MVGLGGGLETFVPSIFFLKIINSVFVRYSTPHYLITIDPVN